MNQETNHNWAFPCVPVDIPTNREQTRKVLHEQQHNCIELIPIEIDFTSRVLSGIYDYDDIYTRFLHEFHQIMDRMVAMKMFKYTRPLKTYFADNYYPTEKAPTKGANFRIFQKFHNLQA